MIINLNDQEKELLEYALIKLSLVQDKDADEDIKALWMKIHFHKEAEQQFIDLTNYSEPFYLEN